jgi:1-acyl-sn-glycerol-3-phosphate acyltransferase/nitroimidazol reductase NimA-like FMN-containing flavoprotein (pyridoxamine 5'-phosphate oxidase superfamily)
VNSATTVDASGLAVLSMSECRRLLEAGGVGRLAVPTDDAPAVRPINFVLDDDRIVIRTGDGVVWRAACSGVQASFEIGDVSNEDHTAWSVLVTGQLREADIAVEDLPLQTWTSAPKERTVALSMESVSGRRISDPRRGDAVVPVPPLSETRWPTTPDDPGGIDPWGRSESVRSFTRRLIDPAYRWWFRVRCEGLEHLPSDGPALLVANHAGAVPVDGALVMHAIERETKRPVYALHHHGLRAVPFVGTALARNGGVVAHPHNAVRLLQQGQRVLVFPEGTKGTTKPYRHRYRLARFGRGGFVETAMRAGAPIVPIVIVGTEETMPTLFRIPMGSEPGLPVTLNSMLFGPLGAIVHFPASITIRVLESIDTDEPANLDSYPSYRVAHLADVVRARMQAELDEMVFGQRGSAS